MRRINIYSACLLLFTAVLGGVSCATDNVAEPDNGKEEKGLLRVGVSFGQGTRLAELGTPDDMAQSVVNGTDYGLKDIGLYIYYAGDYAANDLSQPYVRNLRCTVRNGELVAVLGPGDNPEDRYIFIYDRMTIVAFYPYNEAMSLPENYFSTRSDENKYPVTETDYSRQYYIPYRAQTDTDPTAAFYTTLRFFPKHTYKVEVVVVSEPGTEFLDETGLQVLPANDPVDNPDFPQDGRRVKGYDFIKTLPNITGGSDVKQYVAYIWTKQENRNLISKGDVVLQAGDFMLIASQNVNVTEQNVYRYGYNMSTGEIFIPTSSNLVHDAESLAGVDNSNGTFYQVCDIDLGSISNWAPIDLLGGRFDGGGHAIKNMRITNDAAGAGKLGLFGEVQGNTVVANVNLVDPVIDVTVAADSCFVGGIAGRVNAALSDEDKAGLIANLPPDLSPVVKQALLDELLKSALNSTTKIAGSRVVNPAINVNGNKPRVGGLAGMAGQKEGDGTYKSNIWDSYVLGGSITVNAADKSLNADAKVAGFAGLNNGGITNCYTTAAPVTAVGTEPDPNDPLTSVDVEKGTGFTRMGTDFTPAEGAMLTGNFSKLPDSNTGGVSQFGASSWPSWPTYTGIWPINTTGWNQAPGAGNFWFDMGAYGTPAAYPKLQWERK